MIVYIVSETTQQFDSDCYHYWPEQKTISYHATLESAQEKVKVLIAEVLACIESEIKKDPLYKPKYRRKQLLNTSNNVVRFSNNGIDNGSQEYQRYVVTPITVED